MSAWVHYFIALSTGHPDLLLLIVFLSATAEAIIVVGALFPGTAVILAVSGMAGAANLSLWPFVLLATAGAALGDIASYWIGNHYGGSLDKHWPFSSRPGILENGRKFFARHGGKGVFLSRFVPGLKAVVPAVAGMAGMPVQRFLAADLTSGVLWAAIHVFPAAVAGVLLTTIGSVSGRLVAVLIVSVIAVLLAFWLARLLVISATPRVILLYRSAIWSMARSDKRIIRAIARAGDPRNPDLLAALAWSGLLAAAVIGLGGILQDVIASDPLTRADVAISQLVQTLRTPFFDNVMTVVTQFGDSTVVAVTVATMLIALVLGRRWHAAIVIVSSFAFATITVPAIKEILHRQRPIDLYSGAEFFSFPSGHSTFISLLLVTLTLLVAPSLKLRGLVAAWALALIGVAGVGSSRIYLGAHWPSDVVAGLLYGFVIGCFVALLLRYKSNAGRTGFLGGLAAGAVFLCFGSFHAYANFDAALQRYQQDTRPTLFSKDQWLDAGWKQLPENRIDLLGENEEPLALQFAGPPKKLAEALRTGGWQTTTITGPGAFLKLLSPNTDLGSLPPWPLLHNGKLPVLMTARTSGSDSLRLVLRLWPSPYAVGSRNPAQAIWLGSVTEETIQHPYRALTTMFDEPAEPAAIDGIVKLLESDARFSLQMKFGSKGNWTFLLAMRPRGET